jgi:hypothetical protein
MATSLRGRRPKQSPVEFEIASPSSTARNDGLHGHSSLFIA